MNVWLGWGETSESQAIVEYLVELTDMHIPLDSWLLEAGKAYDEWKKTPDSVKSRPMSHIETMKVFTFSDGPTMRRFLQ
jgi:hypothetical protein